MAASRSTKLCCFLFFFFFWACSVAAQGTGDVVMCENLPIPKCAFAVSSMGKRCVPENEGAPVPQCKTSEIEASRFAGYIETDQCAKTCGIDNVAMSADDLLSQEFASHLCSQACQQTCPNIIDFYSNIAAGEGLSLGQMCQKVLERAMPPSAGGERRAALDLDAAVAPVASRRGILDLMGSSPSTAPSAAATIAEIF